MNFVMFESIEWTLSRTIAPVGVRCFSSLAEMETADRPNAAYYNTLILDHQVLEYWSTRYREINVRFCRAQARQTVIGDLFRKSTNANDSLAACSVGR